MATRDDYELEVIKVQTALALKQAQTGFWKVGIATVAAGAIFGGLIVGLL